MTESAAHL